MRTIAKTFGLLLLAVLATGCSIKHSNELTNGTYRIEPVAVPREIHVHTKRERTVVTGRIEPLANGETDAEGMLRLEVLDANDKLIEKQEACFAPSWENESYGRYSKIVYNSPRFAIVLKNIPPKDAKFRFTVISYGKECAEATKETDTPLIEVN